MPASTLTTWIAEHDVLLWWLFATSIATFLGTLVLIPWLVVRIPADYFINREEYRRRARTAHPVLQVTGTIVRNILGGVFVLAGIAMLVLPGQGLLTILVGVLVMSFPGKFALERALVRRPFVRRSIDWLRHRAGREALRLNDP